tara:strand:- start:72 stop:389 length:318 start_codon:yes stop_codon:yes gene_type:complete
MFQEKYGKIIKEDLRQEEGEALIKELEAANPNRWYVNVYHRAVLLRRGRAKNPNEPSYHNCFAVEEVSSEAIKNRHEEDSMNCTGHYRRPNILATGYFIDEREIL